MPGVRTGRVTDALFNQTRIHIRPMLLVLLEFARVNCHFVSGSQTEPTIVGQVDAHSLTGEPDDGRRTSYPGAASRACWGIVYGISACNLWGFSRYLSRIMNLWIPLRLVVIRWHSSNSRSSMVADPV